MVNRWLVGMIATTVISVGTLMMAEPVSAQVSELQVIGETEPRTFAIAMHHGYPALPIDALAALGAVIEMTPSGADAIILGDTLSFDLYSPVFTDAGRPRQLMAPLYRESGKIYIPAQLFTEWLPESRPDLLTLEGGTLRLSDHLSEAAREPRVVILDPGHGGRDPGNLGRGGVREKDLTLAISRRLAEVLRERGDYEVHLTRTTDTLVALADRPRMANRLKANRPAALFLSIHVNSFSSPSARGFETFFLSEARTEDERRVAEMENSAVEYENGLEEVGALDDLDWIFNNLRNDFYIRASNDLAEVIQRRFGSFHPGPNRGVKQAGFMVLVGAFMPAALVELGFFSNPDEARLLNDPSFQSKMIDGLADAIDEFFVEHEHLWSTEVGG